MQLLNGNGDYYGLGRLIMESLGMASINVRRLSQGLVLGPMVMNGYLLIFMALLIIINNALIATYIQIRQGQGIRDHIHHSRSHNLGNQRIVNSTDHRPWTPQVIVTSLAIATY